MGSRLDRQLWTKIHAASLRVFSPSEFKASLDAGADPWVSYEDEKGRCVSLLEGLCRADTVEREHMLSFWIDRVGDPDASPDKIPALHCLPVQCSPNVIDKLVLAGASVGALSKEGKTPLESFISKLHQEAPYNWKAVLLLRSHSKESLSSLKLTDRNGSRLEFLKLFFGDAGNYYQEDEDVNCVLSNGSWNLDWKVSPGGDWIRKMLSHQLNQCDDPKVWTRAGLDWSGMCSSGMSLPHHILMASGKYDQYGNMLLPVNTLWEALEQGADFNDEGSLGWAPCQRIKTMTWSDSSGDIGNLMASMEASRLAKDTAPVYRGKSARRI